MIDNPCQRLIFIFGLRFILDQWPLSYVILQLIGVPDRAEKDEIVKAVMGLKNVEIDEGYTIDVVTARQVWTSYTLWLVDYKVFLNLAFEMQADKVSGVVVGCCSYLILLCRIFWWMLGISFSLSQNMLVTWGKKSPLNLPFKFLGLGCQVLFAFFKRYTWRVFSPSLIFFLMVHLFTFFYLLLKYFDCCFSIPFVQVGESKLVLEIGQTSLQHQNAKPYTDDLILSMALAEVRNVNN